MTERRRAEREAGSRRRRWPACSALVIALVSVVAPGPSSTDAQGGGTCAVSLDGLLGWWRGEDDLLARVGPALTGSTAFADGFVGRGMRTGPGTQLTAPTLPTVGQAVTVEAWVRPDAGYTGMMRTIASRWDEPGDDDARSYTLQIDPFGALVWTTDDTSSRRPIELRRPAPQLLDGSFHHVAGTFDGVELAAYVDGQRVGSIRAPGTLNAAAGVPFRLGSTGGLGPSLAFDGVLDETSVWQRALTAGEIAAIHGAGVTGKCTLLPVEQARFTTATNSANARFGQAVGVSGTTLVVGAPYSNAATQFGGAAMVFSSADGINWSPQATLVAAGTAPVDFVGYSVDIDADTIVLGSYGNNGGGQDSGAAYVFVRNGATWSQQARLLAADAAPSDGAGYSVSVSGDTIVVGAPLEDATEGDSGAAYVFTRTGTTWTQQAKLVAPNGSTFDNFGASVAIDGDAVVVGAPGANVDTPTGTAFDVGRAFVFRRTGVTWALETELSSSAAAADDEFGTSVAIDGSVAVVGAMQRDIIGGAGAVSVFRRSSGTWSEQARLSASDAGAGSRFGFAVGVAGSRVVVGAPREGPSGNEQRGAVYVFDLMGGTWTQSTKLVASDAAVGDQFGYGVDIGSRIAVGAHLDDDRGNNAGAAYVFSP